MQLLLPAAYTAIALGFVDFVSSSPLVSTRRSGVRSSSISPRPTFCPTRPSPALRSSISSEGSLLFVVCPSRISTHSVSTRNAHYLVRLPSLPPSLRAVPPRVRFLSFSSSVRLVVFAPPCTSPFANESDKTAPSPTVVRVRGGGKLPSRRSKWRTALLARARALLASSCAIRPGTRREIAQTPHVPLRLFADPFADAIKGSDDDVQDGLVHIRIQQRNGRKTLTTVQGLSSEYDLKKIVRACKKEFACNGTVIEHPEYGEVLQLQGDQRENICQWLTKSGLAKPDQLKVHGF